MHLINATRMSVGYNVGLDPDGRELLVVVTKGTFTIPAAGDAVRLHEVQVPLVEADRFAQVPGEGAVTHEADFAPRKAACDVLLSGSARAGGRGVTRLRAGLRVGSMDKSFDVVGNRHWESGLSGIRPSAPQAFETMPVSYDRAFGGTDDSMSEAEDEVCYANNPVGRGWHRNLRHKAIDGKALPNTEQCHVPVDSPRGSYTPMALGPVGRGWPQRACFAGTYDQHWLDEVFPFLPSDFDPRYHQAAPREQQIPLPDGPLAVVLDGFTDDGPRHFVLPHFDAPVHIRLHRGESELHSGRLDTIVFEPDDARVTLTWRVTRPLRKSIFDIAQVQVGSRPREFWGRRGTASTPVTDAGARAVSVA